jgi:hypothetical protein
MNIACVLIVYHIYTGQLFHFCPVTPRGIAPPQLQNLISDLEVQWIKNRQGGYIEVDDSKR